MSSQGYKQFFFRVGGASLLFLIAIQVSKKYVPQYTGIVVLVVCLLCLAYAAYGESRRKKKLRFKERSRGTR